MAEYRALNAERIIAQKKTWYARNAKKQRTQANRWASENPDRVKQNKARHYSLNADRQRVEARQRQAARRVAEPEHARAYDRKSHSVRRARKMGAPGNGYSLSDIGAIRKMQRDKCAICQTRLRGAGHIDHIIPLSRGGAHDRRNLQLLCPTCNCSKGAKDPVDYMRGRGLLL